MFPFAILLLLGVGTAWAISSRPTPVKKVNDELEQVPNVLEFDLTANWGATPPVVRRWAALAELVSGLPGLARALAVRWWSVWRGTEPLAPKDALTELVAKAPNLCLDCFTPDPRAAHELATLLKQGYPVPTWPEGWAKGAYGLGGVLGSTAVFAGSEDARPDGIWQRSRLPLIELEAEPTLTLGHVQAWLGAVLAWRALNRPGAVAADSMNTWGNVFSAVSDPAAYTQGQGIAAKKNYLERALELGIDLSANPGPTKKPGPLHARKLWERTLVYKDLLLVDVGAPPAPAPEQPPKPPPVFIPTPPAVLPLAFPGGLTGRQVATSASGDAAVPMIVALHGRDADVGALEALIPGTADARAFVLRGQIAGETGYRYFDAHLDSPDAAADVQQAATLIRIAIRDLLAQHPTTKLVLVGHGEGGAIALRLAALGFADVAVVGGTALPTPLFPQRASQAQIIMVQGAGEPLPGLATLDAFDVAGFGTFWNTVAGAGHELDQLAEKLRAEVSAAVELPPAPATGFSWAPDCKLEVSDAAATMRYLIPRILLSAGGKTVTPDQLGQAAFSLLTINDQNCVFVDKLVPTGAAAAVQLYLVVRQVITTMLLRGQLPPTSGLELASNALKEAIEHGAPAGELPQLEI